MTRKAALAQRKELLASCQVLLELFRSILARDDAPDAMKYFLVGHPGIIAARGAVQNALDATAD
jgi:hypothetical protein